MVFMYVLYIFMYLLTGINYIISESIILCVCVCVCVRVHACVCENKAPLIQYHCMCVVGVVM